MTEENQQRGKTIFRISLMESYTFLQYGASHVVCKHIDAIGLFIEHDGSQEITPELVRGHLISSRENHCFIEAGTVEEAIKTFHRNWEAASIGGEKRKAKAIWINEKVPIAGLPSCNLLHKSQDNRYICGEEVGYNGNGEYGMCTIENYDSPDSCPMDNFWSCYYNREQAGTLPVKTITIDGVDYPYVMAEDFFSAESSAESPAVIA